MSRKRKKKSYRCADYLNPAKNSRLWYNRKVIKMDMFMNGNRDSWYNWFNPYIEDVKSRIVSGNPNETHIFTFSSFSFSWFYQKHENKTIGSVNVVVWEDKNVAFVYHSKGFAYACIINDYFNECFLSRWLPGPELSVYEQVGLQQIFTCCEPWMTEDKEFPLQFKSSHFVDMNQGRIYIVQNPVRCNGFAHLIGRPCIIDGHKRRVIKGVEHFMKAGYVEVGEQIGLLVKGEI